MSANYIGEGAQSIEMSLHSQSKLVSAIVFILKKTI